MDCIVCDAIMAQKKDWHFVCDACGFEASTLQAGPGIVFEGLETLRRSNFEAMLKRLEKFRLLSDMKVLEVGCGDGWFLETVSSHCVDVEGIEPSDKADTLVEKGYSIRKGFFPDVLSENETFDIIVFNDVFEHLPDPVMCIKKCETHLKNDGILMINLPSKDGIFYRLSKILDKFGMSQSFERMWQSGLSSPHLTYFSPSTLEKFGAKHSDLKAIDSFALPSVTFDGLWRRIRSSYALPASYVVYAVCMCIIPFLSILPKDICVVFFQKQSEA